MAQPKCSECNPLVIGWCDHVYNTKGKMLDEKCPRVGAFVEYVAEQTGKRIVKFNPECPKE
jgi:hypothetical protein